MLNDKDLKDRFLLEKIEEILVNKLSVKEKFEILDIFRRNRISLSELEEMYQKGRDEGRAECIDDITYALKDIL